MRVRDLAIAMAVALLTGCVPVGPHTVRIALVAPFEGRFREIGYDVVPAARLAVLEYATMSRQYGLAIELVAYDDTGDPEQARRVAKRVLQDKQVHVVVGHWLETTTIAAAPTYANADMPLVTVSQEDLSGDNTVNLSPDYQSLQGAAYDLNPNGELIGPRLMDYDVMLLGHYPTLATEDPESRLFATVFHHIADSTNPYWTAQTREDFVNGFRAGSLGAEPGIIATSAYEAVWIAIELTLDEAGVAFSSPVTETMRFGEDGHRQDATIYIYGYEGGSRTLIKQVLAADTTR